MNLHEYQHLKAECAELNKLLAQIPETDVIDRKSLLARKNAVEIELANADNMLFAREPIRAKLTFKGKPVVGSHGIFAEFGAKIVDNFANTVAAFAASLHGQLGTTGAIPDREKYQLLITGTALGSFGFELEEHTQNVQPDLLPSNAVSSVEHAIEKVLVLMKGTLDTDDVLADLATETDPRAVAALKCFLQLMADQGAFCALETRDKIFHFKDADQVRRSAQRLSIDNIKENEEKYVGAFLGILPMKRTFEFRTTESEVISGKIDSVIEDAGQINHILEKTVEINVHVTRVGEGRPRYVLLHYSQSVGP